LYFVPGVYRDKKVVGVLCVFRPLVSSVLHSVSLRLQRFQRCQQQLQCSHSFLLSQAVNEGSSSQGEGTILFILKLLVGGGRKLDEGQPSNPSDLGLTLYMVGQR
jgi:hypothetical protein